MSWVRGEDRKAETVESGIGRRERIMETLEAEEAPVSGAELARRMGVSRQVIVQDMALLRIVHKNIISTNRGYLLYKEPPQPERYRRVVKVRHGREDIMRELDCIVDAGGHVINVIVEHEIYGRLVGELSICSRADVRKFIGKVEANKSRPLTELTQGVHFHTIEADSMEALEAAVRALEREGFLCGQSD